MSPRLQPALISAFVLLLLLLSASDFLAQRRTEGLAPGRDAGQRSVLLANCLLGSQISAQSTPAPQSGSAI